MRPPTPITAAVARLRWNREEVVASVESMAPAVVARSFAYFFGIGAAVVALVPLLPGRQIDHSGTVIAAVAAATLVAVWVLWRYDDAPAHAVRALPSIGTVLVTAVLCGVVASAVPAFFLMYLWVVLSGCYFFTRRVGTLHVAGVAAASAAVFIARDVPSAAVIWVVGNAAFAVTGTMLALLRERADTLILQLDKAAHTDALTGLPNRRAFKLRLDEELYRAHRTSQPLGLLAIDIDAFKAINDQGGHAAGDTALCALAEVLATGRRIDLSARLGGDEFALLLPATHEAGSLEVARRLHCSYDHPISIGVAAYPSDADSADDLLRAADLALYAVKEQGGASTLRYDAAIRD
jgi:diguanylate cyclase (GGDEF)-like protein